MPKKKRGSRRNRLTAPKKSKRRQPQENNLLQPTDVASPPPADHVLIGVEDPTEEPQSVVETVVTPINGTPGDIGDVIVLCHDSVNEETLPKEADNSRNASSVRYCRKPVRSSATEEPQSVVETVVTPINGTPDDIGDVIVLYHDGVNVETLPKEADNSRNASCVIAYRKPDVSSEKGAASDVKSIAVSFVPPKTSGIFRVGEQPGAQDISPSDPRVVFKVSSMVLEVDQLSDTSEDNIEDNKIVTVNTQEASTVVETPVVSNVHQGPCTMKDVEREVTRLISSDYWTCLARGDTLHVMYGPFATHNFIIQRAVTVDAKGVVVVSVHNEPLSLEHELWKLLPPIICLEGNDVGPFSNYVSSVVTVVRWYDICKGIPAEEKYAQLIGECPNLRFDANPFQERRYSTAYRSTECLKLVNVSRTQRCKRCKDLNMVVDRRLRRQSEREGSPPVRTNYRYLTPKQRLERMEKRKESRKASRAAYYVKKKIQGQAVACHIMAEQINYQISSASKKKSSKKLPEVNLNMCHPGALLDSII